jgi:hypothetical protein
MWRATTRIGGGARPVIALCVGGGLALAGCASEPLLDPGLATPPLALVPTTETGIVDGRGRFREIYCALSQDHGPGLPDHRPCDQALHQLADEPPARGAPVNLGRARIALRLVIVPGLAAACFGDLAQPLRDAAGHVEQLGYEVSWIDVDALSSSGHNAEQVRDAILAMEETAERPIVVLGYSKGATDLLEALADPQVAARIASVVSLSGAINGSPLADKASETLLDVLTHLPGTTCEPGDHGALNSLRRSTRMAWLTARWPLPSIRSYSLISYADREHVSWVLRSSYDDLSLIDPRNDSQLLFYDQVTPDSTLLGYLDADHWAVALPLGRNGLLNALVDRNAFPREILLEAILKQVEEDLIADQRAEGDSVAALERASAKDPRGRAASKPTVQQP